jgi:hypothetical protein
MVQLNDNYEKNIQALKDVDIVLATKIIQSAAGESFELSIISSEHHLYNILDHMQERALYNSIVDELQDQIQTLQTEVNTPFIYLFGIGNGYTLPILLENSHHRRITVFEVDLELLFVTLHLYDFSEAIRLGRLKFFHCKSLRFVQAVHLLKDHNAYHHTRSFKLIPTANYYTKYFSQELKALQALLTQALSYHLNLIRDFQTQLLHLKQQQQNLSLDLNLRRANEARPQQTKPSWSFIIHQNIDEITAKTLAKLQGKVTLICSDFVLPNLIEHNIQPDIVSTIEYNLQLWETIPKAVQSKLTLLIPNYYQDLSTLQTPQQKILAHHPINNYYDLHQRLPFLYHTDSLSLAFEYSYLTNHTHTLIVDEQLSCDNTLSFQTLAYLVSRYSEKLTSYILSDNKVEQLEMQAKSLPAICELIDKQDSTIPQQAYSVPTSEEIQALITRHQFKSRHLLQLAHNLLETIQTSLQKIQPWYDKLEGLQKEALINCYSDDQIVSHVDTIASIRAKIEQEQAYQSFFHDFLEPTMLLTYIEMSAIQSSVTLTASDHKAKAMQWAIINYQWLNQLQHGVSHTIEFLIEQLAD